MVGGAVPVTHVVGAGMAGLSAATALVQRGQAVRLYESTGHAGGRCRSFRDDQLGCDIDNGNHLILSGNMATQKYLARIGAEDRVNTTENAAYPFMDLKSGERWTLDLGHGKGAWRLLSRRLGVPEVSRLDLLMSALRFRRASSSATVLDQLGGKGRAGAIYGRLWEPLCLAILNTEPEQAMAAAMWPVLQQTLGRGPDACRPLTAKHGLSHTLVAPALEYLRKAGTDVRFNATLKALETGAGGITALRFNEAKVEIAPSDKVILALPIAGVNTVMPDITTPDGFRSIVNAHFRILSGPDETGVMGLINGDAHWIFRKKGVVSVTVSAATSLVDAPSREIAARLWRDVCVALNIVETPMAPHRIIKEKRATFSQTPDQNRRRPGAATDFNNLFLAGDWTATGLPATIEGAIYSGETAAKLCR